MWIRLIALSLLALFSSGGGAATDDYKMIKLEQDVRNLERQVSELTRQVTALQRLEPQSAQASRSSSQPSPQESTDEVPWYNRQNWDRVRNGMDELDVIRLLGKPTTMRSNDAESRSLLYAVEIGSSGFLGGSVELKNHQVVAVNKPILK